MPRSLDRVKDFANNFRQTGDRHPDCIHTRLSSSSTRVSASHCWVSQAVTPGVALAWLFLARMAGLWGDLPCCGFSFGCCRFGRCVVCLLGRKLGENLGSGLVAFLYWRTFCRCGLVCEVHRNGFGGCFGPKRFAGQTARDRVVRRAC